MDKNDTLVVPLERLTKGYLAGFFASSKGQLTLEGGSTICATISKAGSINFLNAIAEKYAGEVTWTIDKDADSISCRGDDAAVFIRGIIDSSYDKRARMAAALQFHVLQAGNPNTSDPTIVAEKDRLARLING